MAKIRGFRVKYISCSQVFEGRPLAKQALEDSGQFSYGENDLSLVAGAKLRQVLRLIDIDGDDELGDEIDEACEFLNSLDAEIYIDLEAMAESDDTD